MSAIRQAEPFQRDDVDLIRRTLRAKKDWRQLSLFSVGIDAMLRASDLLRLRVSDLRDGEGRIRDTLGIRQQKTAGGVRVYLSDATRDVIQLYLREYDKWTSDWMWTAARDPHAARHLSDTHLREWVKQWAKIAHRDPTMFSAHSLRRTKASMIYAETRNIEAVRQLLGHASVTATSRYLNVTAAEVEAIARRYEI